MRTIRGAEAFMRGGALGSVVPQIEKINLNKNVLVFVFVFGQDCSLQFITLLI